MEKESTYVIYTDASFDDFTKIGTYSIIIMKDNNIKKSIAKRCRIQLNNSTECEIFAIYHAITIILNCYIKDNIKQKFKFRTDCKNAVDFFISKEITCNMFKSNTELLKTMKNTYKRFYKKLKKVESSISITWIPREANKVAHKWTYNAFQRLKGYTDKKEIAVISTNALLELLSENQENYGTIIKYLYAVSDEQKVIRKTQEEIAYALDISTTKANCYLKKLVNLDILRKIKNGKYALLI